MAAKKNNAVVEPTETTEQAAVVEPVEAIEQTAALEPVEAAAQVTVTKPAKAVRQAAAYPYNRTLKFGADGEDVKALQKALFSSGLDVAVSGVFDLRTVRAVQQLQWQKRLPETGIVGKRDYPTLLGYE